jgi:hypothetical protein
MQKLHVQNAYPPTARSWRIGERPAPSLGAGGQVSLFPVVVGLAGAGVLYAAKNEEGHQKMALQALGFAGLGYGIYGLISAFSSKEGGSKGDEGVKISTPQSFNSVSAAFLSPIPDSTVSVGAWSGKYPVKVLLSNAAASKVDLFWQIIAREVPSYFAYGTGNAREGQVAQGDWSLAAKDSRQIPLELPLMTSRFFSPDIEVHLELQARRSASDPWKIMSVVNFKVDL